MVERRNLNIFLCSIIFIIILTTLLNGGKGLFNLSIISIFILILWISFIIKIYSRKEPLFLQKIFLLPLTTILIWSFITIPVNKFLFAGIKNFLQLTIYIIFLILFINCCRDKINILITTIGIICLFQSLLIIYQRISSIYPVGTIPNNPNFVASIISVITIFNIGLLIKHVSQSVNPGNYPKILITDWTNFWLPIIIIPFGVLSLLLLPTRSALLSFYIVLGLLFYKKYGLKGLSIYLFLTITIFLLFKNDVIIKIIRLNDKYAFYHTKLWLSAIKITVDNPIYGVGLGSFGNFFPRYNFPTLDSVTQYGRLTDFAHNEFLQISAELGLPGLIIVIWITILILVSIKNNTVVLYPILVFFIQCFFNIILHLPLNIFIVIILLTINYYSANREKYDKIIFENIELNITKKMFTILIFVSIIILIIFINILLGELFYKTRTYEGYKIAVKFNPINPEYYLKLIEKENNKENKILLLNKCIKIDSENFIYYLDLANLYSSLIDKNNEYIIKAIGEYKISIEKNPYNAITYFMFGKLCFYLKEYNKAREYFIKSYLLEPNFSKAVYFIAKCSQLLNEQNRANLEYSKFKRLQFKLKTYPIPNSGYDRFILK